MKYIYKIYNNLNNNSYIGKTTSNIDKYIETHFEAKDPNKYLHRAIRKYGKENFLWKILWEGKCNNDHLNNLEKFFIAYYDTYNGNGYNLTSGGDGGRTYTKETMLKEKRIDRGLKIKNIRIKNGSYKKGDDCHLSKAKSSKEEIKKRTKLSHKTAKERGTDKVRIANGTKTRKENGVYIKSDEEQVNITKKRLKSLNNRSNEKKIEDSKRKTETWKNRSDEETANSLRKRLKTISKRTDKEKIEYFKKLSKSQIDGKNGNAKKCIIFNIKYDTLKEVVEKLKISLYLINKQLKDPNNLDYQYIK